MSRIQLTKGGQELQGAGQSVEILSIVNEGACCSGGEETSQAHMDLEGWIAMPYLCCGIVNLPSPAKTKRE